MCRGYIYNIGGDEMNHREKVLAIRNAIELIVKGSADITSKYLAELFNLSVRSINRMIVDMDNIHRQNDILYYGERL